MAHRVGVCGSCRARFQIPATFTPNRARCRTCGGVVEIGATQSGPQETPQPAPARVEVKQESRPVPAEVSATRVPVHVEPRPAAPARTQAPAPAPVAAPLRPSPQRPPAKKRGVLVPALVAGGVLAILIFGAFQLLSRNDPVAASTPSSSPPSTDASGPADPKTSPSAAEDVARPR